MDLLEPQPTFLIRYSAVRCNDRPPVKLAPPFQVIPFVSVKLLLRTAELTVRSFLLRNKAFLFCLLHLEYPSSPYLRIRRIENLPTERSRCRRLIRLIPSSDTLSKSRDCSRG